MTRLGIVGGAGRMGQMMAHSLAAQADFEVVALIDPLEPQQGDGAAWCSSIEELAGDEVDVIVDFSVPDVTRRVLAWCLEHGVALVAGTSGLTIDEVMMWAPRVDGAGGHVLYASNFSLGAVLAQRFSAQAAAYFERVEIIELHHDRKVDSPSATSLATAKMIGDARRVAGRAAQIDPTKLESLAHARGAEGPEGVRIHSVRLPGLVAHQEVIFAGPGEGLTIRHDSYDRVSFVAGVALAIRAMPSRRGLTVGLLELI